MLIDDIAEAGDRVTQLETELRAAMGRRNLLVAEALANGERAMDIAITLSVTPARVYQMRDLARGRNDHR